MNSKDWGLPSWVNMVPIIQQDRLGGNGFSSIRQIEFRMPVANLCGIIKINYTNLELTQEFQRERKQTNKKQSALVKYIWWKPQVPKAWG